jgi:hypothetical protein
LGKRCGSSAITHRLDEFEGFLESLLALARGGAHRLVKGREVRCPDFAR